MTRTTPAPRTHVPRCTSTATVHREARSARTGGARRRCPAPATTLTLSTPRSAARRVAASTTSRPMPRPPRVGVDRDGEDLGGRQVGAVGGRVAQRLEHPPPATATRRGAATAPATTAVAEHERAVEAADVGRVAATNPTTSPSVVGHDAANDVGATARSAGRGVAGTRGPSWARKPSVIRVAWSSASSRASSAVDREPDDHAAAAGRAAAGAARRRRA